MLNCLPQAPQSTAGASLSSFGQTITGCSENSTWHLWHGNQFPQHLNLIAMMSRSS